MQNPARPDGYITESYSFYLALPIWQGEARAAPSNFPVDNFLSQCIIHGNEKEKTMEDKLIKKICLWDIFDCNSIDAVIEELQKLKAKYGNEYNLHFDVKYDYFENSKTVRLIGEKK